MRNLLSFVLSGVLFVCVVLLVDALVGIIRRSSGVDEEAVGRRLSAAAQVRERGALPVDILLAKGQEGRTWHDFVPFIAYYRRLFLQSATKLTLLQMICIIGIIAFVVAAIIFLIAPAYLSILAIPAGLVAGIAPVTFVLARQRAQRVARFEDQLPDAIDLVVRSLKVGHPLSSAIGVIGREMADPIGTEFTIAADQVSYGKSIPEALSEMQDRVPVRDLGYLVVAVQIQNESGGNLVESLAKLSTVIRERFRMFRKAKAITAEGRISAWLLSIFPFVIGGLVLLVKPDYYSQVEDYPYFTGLVVITIILLIVNIFAMRILTTLKI